MSNDDIPPPLLVFLYRNQSNRQFPKKYERFKSQVMPHMVRFNKSGFNCKDLLNEYFEKILVFYNNRSIKPKKKKLMLLLDDASFHRMKL